MKGRLQCVCSTCGLEKGDRDRNHGWFEVAPRSARLKLRVFCPQCSVALMVALDTVMSSSPDPTLMVVGKRQMKIALALATNHERNQYEMKELEAHLLASGVTR